MVRVRGSAVDSIRLEENSAALLELGDVPPDRIFHAVMAVHSKGVELILIHGTEAVEKQLGGMPATIRSRYADGTDATIAIDVGTILVLSNRTDKNLDGIADGTRVAVTVKADEITTRSTFNAVGYLPGLDKGAGTLLISAHLDHLGVGKPVNGDSIYNGADDDAAGTTAVELHFTTGMDFACYEDQET